MRRVAAVSLAALLSACGGGDGEDRTPRILVDQTNTHTFAAPGGVPTSGHTVTINGPTAQVPSFSGSTRYCFETTLTQRSTQATTLTLSVAPAGPKQGPWVDATGLAAAGADTALTKTTCAETRPVNVLQQLMQVAVRASAACQCLGDYEVRVRWTATFYPD